MISDHLKVCHIYPVWLPQTQTWMYNQVKYLPPTIDFQVLCERTENLAQFAVPNIHCLAESSRLRRFWDRGLRKFRVRRHLGYYVRCARQIGADIVHSNFGDVAWLNLGAVKRVGAKHVVTFYGYDVNMLPKSDARWLWRYQRLFSEADLFLCEGPHMRKCLINLGCPEEKVRIHHLGVEVDKIAFRPRAWRPGEALRILIAATFREKKGIPYALEALSQIQHDVPVEITIIGDALQESRGQREKRNILSTLARTGLEKRTRMLGYQKPIVLWEQAYQHQVFLSPSVTASDGDTEGGSPVAIIEMQASGMPVIATTHCDIPSVIPPENCELLAAERDVAGLVDRLRLLIEDPPRWKSIADSGRRHVEQQFDANTQGKDLGKIYSGLVQRSK